jgi:glycosyltransferase involved in cell wall biosynthesis
LFSDALPATAWTKKSVKVLLLNQCFWPDVMATAQQLTGLARGLAERGHSVTVLTGRRGYDDAKIRFPSRERWNGIEIIRLPSIGLGKTSRWRRALNFASFSLACVCRLAIMPRQDAVVALTSPPLISWLATLFTRLKGGRLIFWVMDLNPDEAIAAGWLKPDSLIAKILAALLRSSMRRAQKIIALDRFAKERIVDKGIQESKIEIIPPWSYDDAAQFDREGREVFRRRHNLSEKFVVMYAGNHSPCHPLDTLLEAAKKLRARDDIVFCFVGGGSEFGKVADFARANKVRNIRCLPYQPQAELSGVLSAADLHVVVMGDGYQGIIHPCKIYNVLTVGSPFVYIGPLESHVSEIISRLPEHGRAFSAQHGQVDLVAKSILSLAENSLSAAGVETVGSDRGSSASQTVLSATPRSAGSGTPAVAQEFSSRTLLPRFIAQIELLRAQRKGLAKTSVGESGPDPKTEVFASDAQ